MELTEESLPNAKAGVGGRRVRGREVIRKVRRVGGVEGREVEGRGVRRRRLKDRAGERRRRVRIVVILGDIFKGLYILLCYC